MIPGLRWQGRPPQTSVAHDTPDGGLIVLPVSRRSSHAPGTTPLDQALLVLLRVVMVHGWRPEEAARRLRVRLHDDRRLMQLLRARVAHAMLERPTGTDERAFATLEHALGDHDRLDSQPPAWVPRQRRGSA